MSGLCATAANAAGEKDYQAYAAKLDKWAYNGTDLGATFTEKGTTFKLWSPYADGVTLTVYEKGSEDEGGETVATKEMKLDKKTDGSTFRRTPISRSPLDKNPMPGHLFELHPVNEVNTKGQ